MRIAGVDYSLRCPAVCIFEGDKKFCISKCTMHFMSGTKKYNQTFSHNIHGTLMQEHKHECQRYGSISNWALNILEDCDFVCIEDYAFTAKGKVFHIGENTGILKYRLWEKKIQYKTVPPTQIKKFGTGRGNAKKEDMYAAFKAECRLDLQRIFSVATNQIKSPITDITDSYYICKYGHYINYNQ
jgi:Holliday junction resolvasome RuvABC endonuclease subunit